MKLGDLVLTHGSSSSSSISSSDPSWKGMVGFAFKCGIDIQMMDVIETEDESFLAVGTNYWDYGIIVKFNTDEVLWVKELRYVEWVESGDYGSFHRVIESDGYFYIQGKAYSEDYVGCVSTVLVKMDQDGNVLWEKLLYSGWADDFCGGLVECHDPDYIMSFISWYDGQNDLNWSYSPVLCKVRKSDGALIWNKGFKTDGYTLFLSIDKIEGGGYITACGCSEEYAYLPWIDYVPYVIKVDNDGNKVWGRKYYRVGGYCNDTPSQITSTSDGGFIMTIDGSRYARIFLPGGIIPPTEDTDVLIYKLSSTGDIQWCKRVNNASIDAGDDDDGRGGIIEIPDGYVFPVFNSNDEQAIIKLNLDGSFGWGRTINTNNPVDDSMYGFDYPQVKKTSTGILLIGMSFSNAAYADGSIIAKIGFNGSYDNCPFIYDHIGFDVEDYTSSVFSTHNYAIVKPFDRRFNDHPRLSYYRTMDLYKFCDRYDCSENDTDEPCKEPFFYADGALPSRILQYIEGVGEQPQVSHHELLFTQDAQNVGIAKTFQYGANFYIKHNASFGNSLQCTFKFNKNITDNQDGYIGIIFGDDWDYSLLLHFNSRGTPFSVQAQSNTVDKTWIFNASDWWTYITLFLTRESTGIVTASVTSNIWYRAWGGPYSYPSTNVPLVIGTGETSLLRPGLVGLIADTTKVWIDNFNGYNSCLDDYYIFG